MTVNASKEELKIVLEKLDDIQIDLMRLRAMLLPQIEPTDEEKKEIEASVKQFKKGQWTKLEDLTKELCCKN